jgi:tRNA dimethylallyltransferase
MVLSLCPDQDIFEAPLLFLAGPTAIGKTDLALTLAEEFGCEIIGVDSMQIYRYMDIGTAKPSLAERGRVPHYLIDYVMPDEEFSASRFVSDCREAIREIRAKGRMPMLVGGTGLYFNALENGIFTMPEIDQTFRHDLQKELESRGREALVEEIERTDPHSAARIHPNDTYRLLRALEIVRATGKPWSQFIAEHQGQKRGGAKATIIKIGLNRDRDELYQRIDQRVGTMINAGFLIEVETLLKMGYTANLRPMQSLGYRHMLNFLAGEWDWERAVELLARDTRRYAKRQLTWFKADTELSWFHPDQVSEIAATITGFLEGVKHNNNC